LAIRQRVSDHRLGGRAVRFLLPRETLEHQDQIWEGAKKEKG
jgi:hypothetical protein